MPINWGYGLGAKGGQTSKKKDGDVITTDKSIEFGLKVKLKSFDGDSISETVGDILEQIEGLEDCTLSFAGPKAKLERSLKQIAGIIAENGGQETLDIHIEGQKSTA